MSLSRSLRPLLLLISLGLTTATSATEPDKTLPPLSFKDSKGQSQTLNPELRRLYLSADRQGGGLIKDAMKGLDQSTLDAQNAVAIADISDAPGFVRRLIRGSLEDRSYRTWMDESGSSRPVLPYRDKRVTVVELEALKITAIRHLADVDALRAELLAPVAPPPPPAADPASDHAAKPAPTESQRDE